MLAKEVDAEAEEELGYEAQAHAEVKQFSREDLETHAAFVVQQMTPVLGRHALKVRLIQWMYQQERCMSKLCYAVVLNL